jgi:asparagine synthase (glutamine-hydrolysing)
MDEPMAGPGLFPQYMVARRAAQEVKVVLSGHGGDEIFGGYTRYVIAYLEQALKGAISETFDEGEHIVSLQSILPNLPFLRRYIPTLRYFWESDLFEPMDRRYFRLIDRSLGDRGSLHDDFKAGFNQERIFSRFQAVFNHPDTLSYYNKMVHFDMCASLPALLHVEDRVTMACSLESRVPLLDHRIVELVTRMPPRMKFKGAEMKYVLKRSMKDILPEKTKWAFPCLSISGPGTALGRFTGMFFCPQHAKIGGSSISPKSKSSWTQKTPTDAGYGAS